MEKMKKEYNDKLQLKQKNLKKNCKAGSMTQDAVEKLKKEFALKKKKWKIYI